MAPVSWVVVDDVNQGRSHLNLSDWAAYDRKKAGKVLEEMCEEVEDGGMPLRSYRWTHPEARLSQSDVALICDWSRAQRQRLAEAGPAAESAASPVAAPSSH